MSFLPRISLNFTVAAGIAAIGVIGTGAHAQEAGATANLGRPREWGLSLIYSFGE